MTQVMIQVQDATHRWITTRILDMDAGQYISQILQQEQNNSFGSGRIRAIDKDGRLLDIL